MAEQIGVNPADFRPSYRPERKQAGAEPDMKRMGLIAAAFGGGLALLMGGSMLMRAGHHTIPVIEADAQPVRVKPDNPGGMQVSGADMVPAGAVAGPHLAPAAEQPEISQLRAQVRSMHRELLRQEQETALLAKEHAERAQPHPAQLAAATPGIAPGAARMVAAVPPVERASATARVPVQEAVAAPSGNEVQLAAFADEKAAQVEWAALTKRQPQLLGGRTPEISKVEAAGHVMYRLRTGGFDTVADATGFCAKMRARGESCSIAAF